MGLLYDSIPIKNQQLIKTIITAATSQGRVLTPDEINGYKQSEVYGADLQKFFDSFREGENGYLQKTIVSANVAAYLQNPLNFNYVIIDGLFYVYANGYYTRDTNNHDRIKLSINNLIDPVFRSKNRASEVIEQLKTPDHIKTINQMNTHPARYICFKNGVYDPLEKKLLPHSPHYLFLNQIPFDFNPEDKPKGDIIERFFSDIRLSEENRVMLLSFIGLCMTTDASLQKFIVLKGTPGTGKSQLLNLIKHIVGGEANCSAESLEEVTGNRFRAYNVLGKLCNINADLTTEGAIDPAIIKRIVGEDTLSVERKHSQAIDITPYAKFLFAMNGFPLIKAKDNSFYRRVMILPMMTEPEKENTNLQRELRSQSDYLIHEAVKALENYYQLEDKHSIESQESKDLVETWKQRGDTVSAFLHDTDPFNGRRELARNELFEQYKEYCGDEERQPLTKHNFYESLRSKGYQEKTINGTRCIEDLNYKDEFRTAQEPSPFE